MSAENNIFENEKINRINNLSKDIDFKQLSAQWLEESMRKEYVYNFTWLGRPIIQNPIDIIALQEIIWKVKPDLIIETGVAHGGSVLFSASMLELNSLSGGPIDAKVIGIDIDIRKHNLNAIINHPLSKRIVLLEGSSISDNIKNKVTEMVHNKQKILVCLDSNHTHQHVLSELQFFSTFVSKESYCIVYDTFVEDVPEDVFKNRPWRPGNSPKSAVHEFLRSTSDFQIDYSIENKLMITVAPNGYLKRIK